MSTDLKAENLRVDVYSSGSAGSVRIVHIPDGQVVHEDFGAGHGSQLAAKERALLRLRQMVHPLLHDEGVGL